MSQNQYLAKVASFIALSCTVHQPAISQIGGSPLIGGGLTTVSISVNGTEQQFECKDHPDELGLSGEAAENYVQECDNVLGHFLFRIALERDREATINSLVTENHEEESPARYDHISRLHFVANSNVASSQVGSIGDASSRRERASLGREAIRVLSKIVEYGISKDGQLPGIFPKWRSDIYLAALMNRASFNWAAGNISVAITDYEKIMSVARATQDIAMLERNQHAIKGAFDSLVLIGRREEFAAAYQHISSILKPPIPARWAAANWRSISEIAYGDLGANDTCNDAWRYTNHLVTQATQLMEEGRDDAAYALAFGGYFDGPDLCNIMRHRDGDISPSYVGSQSANLRMFTSRHLKKRIEKDDFPRLTKLSLASTTIRTAVRTRNIAIADRVIHRTLRESSPQKLMYANQFVSALVERARSTNQLTDIENLVRLNFLTARPYRIEANAEASFQNEDNDTELLLNFASIMKAERTDPSNTILIYKRALDGLASIEIALEDATVAQRRAFFVKWRGVYEGLQELLVSETRFAEAEYVARLVKGLENAEHTRSGSLDFSMTFTPGEIERNQRLNTILSDFQSDLEFQSKCRSRSMRKVPRIATSSVGTPRYNESTDAASSSQMKLAKCSSRYWLRHIKAVKRWERPTLKTEDNLPAQMAVAKTQSGSTGITLTIIPMEREVRIFLRTPNGVTTKKSDIPRAQINEIVFATRLELERARTPAIANDPEHMRRLQQLFGELYRHMVEPVELDLARFEGQVLTFNLHGSLRYIPVAALRSSKGWLIEKYPVRMAVQPDKALEIAATPVSKLGGVGFGTSLAVSGFSALPSVPYELNSIFATAERPAPIVGPIFLNFAFNRNNLATHLGQRPQIVHIASHFAVRPGGDLSSSLLLGDGNLLTLAELRLHKDFNLSGIELVTLSACETALNADGNGAEIDGLAATMISRGARNVLASLWSVDDFATSELMARFYTFAAKEDDIFDESLRHSQLEMISSQDLNNPFYWAPFILMGHPKSP